MTRHFVVLAIVFQLSASVLAADAPAYFRKNQVDTAQGMIERVRQRPARTPFSQQLTELHVP